ncbi:Eae-like protein [Salmonella enterica subsp. enterica]|nr:Eae-like protein [Salmonella enterica subsp. enterica]ECI4751148.1 Eae-like protein [Salmonella enterica subsp. enterica]
MKEVKIYTIVSDQLSPPITGESFCTDMVRHSDYAELEDKYAALAADNDKAMESLKQADAVVKLAHEKFSALAAENAGLKHAMAVTLEHVSVTDAGQAGVAAMIINDALHHGETPATDAFLAEVRAQGVEMFADKYRAQLTALPTTSENIFDAAHVSLRYQIFDADEFAAQLRKGVQS